MSRPLPAAADLIAQATEPCHHARPADGPCPICLEDIVESVTRGTLNDHAREMEELKDAWHEDAESIAAERDEAQRHAEAADRLVMDLKAKLLALQGDVIARIVAMEEATEVRLKEVVTFVEQEASTLATLVEERTDELQEDANQYLRETGADLDA